MFVNLVYKGIMKLKTAIKHFGTQTRIAAVLGLSDAAVSRWHDEPYYGNVPIKTALRLVRASEGELAIGLKDYE